MNGARKPKLFNLVAVLDVAAGEPVEVGDVGTVVELLPPDGAGVEFIDRSGRTRCIATFKESDLLVLNRDRTPVG